MAKKPEEDVSIFRSRLKIVREEKGVTRSRLAEDAGVSRPFLYQIEGGYATISVGYLQKVASGLGVSVQCLITRGCHTGTPPICNHDRYGSPNCIYQRVQQSEKPPQRPVLGIRFVRRRPQR